MDRKFKAKDKVHVHQDSKEGPVIKIFQQAPYSMHGYDNYIYHGCLYKGFVENDRVYILLSEPVNGR